MNKRNPAAKVLRALSWLVTQNQPSFGVRELAEAWKMSPSSVHRLLSVLAAEDFVRKDAATSRYSLGAQLLRLANIAAVRSPLAQIALPRMQRLVDASGESALLGHFDAARLEMMFVSIVESTATLRYTVELNTWMPLHAGASGLAILAYLSPEEIDRVIRNTRLRAITDRTITDKAKLEATLRQIVRRGYALTRGQRLPGAVGIGAPVFGPHGRVVADVCLTVPEQRFEGSDLRLPSLVVNCAAAISRDIGAERGAAQSAGVLNDSESIEEIEPSRSARR